MPVTNAGGEPTPGFYTEAGPPTRRSPMASRATPAQSLLAPLALAGEAL
ncbi:hypothetical protein [Bisbaumannia pacifica]|uniref:Uncharacterized protein n=1 Tax=Bisbaumannia pacifica TaxID=77098 RepID=A0ABD4L6E5_9GAMM|nr:hypothetical protein [Halomonas pacifica]MBH8581566.1 hypothetical protein [Halomonas pacifica]